MKFNAINLMLVAITGTFVSTAKASSPDYFFNRKLNEIFIVGTHNSLAVPGKVWNRCIECNSDDDCGSNGECVNGGCVEIDRSAMETIVMRTTNANLTFAIGINVTTNLHLANPAEGIGHAPLECQWHMCRMHEI